MDLPDIPANRDLLRYLAAQARPGTGRGYDLDGWELHTHPDLIQRLEEMAGSSSEVVAAYGVVVIAPAGVAAVVAVGTDTLLFRLPAAPDDVELEDPIEPLSEAGWYAVSAWQSQLPSTDGLQKLTRLGRQSARHARDLAPTQN